MRKKELFIFTIVMAIMMIFIGTVKSQAVLQSNPTTHTANKKIKGNEWIIQIRQMEQAGQTMGLHETIDTNTGLSTSGSNGIDVHMMKSTEYGAIAILSASGYGNPKTIQDSTVKTTTGNNTGVFMGTSWEGTTGITSNCSTTIDARYKNIYDESAPSSDVYIGDALVSCLGWHGAAYSASYRSGEFFNRGGLRHIHLG